MDGKDILQTLIKLLETQEQIKITYTVREKGGDLTMNVNLYEHQKQALIDTAGKNHVAYYHDMGL